MRIGEILSAARRRALLHRVVVFDDLTSARRFGAPIATVRMRNGAHEKCRSGTTQAQQRAVASTRFSAAAVLTAKRLDRVPVGDANAMDCGQFDHDHHDPHVEGEALRRSFGGTRRSRPRS